jgi:chromate transporter
VVGVLAAALYSPIWTSAVHAPTDFLWAAAAFAALAGLRTPPLWVVAASAAVGLVLPR